MTHPCTCLICNTPFEGRQKHARYCSAPCRNERPRLYKEERSIRAGKITERAKPLGPTYAELRAKIDVLETKAKAKGEPSLLLSLRQFSPAPIVRECARVGCFNTFKVKGGRPPKKFCSKQCSGKHRADNAAAMVPSFFAPKAGTWSLPNCPFYPPDGIPPVQMLDAYGRPDRRMPDRGTGV